MIHWLKQLFAPIIRRKTLGERGELLAARHLRKMGYKIVMRNYRGGDGEIDIVARQNDQLVFVEVKTRRSDQYTQPHRHVTHFKQHKLTRAARAYLSHYRDRQPRARFDVVSIVWPEGQAPRVVHIPNAFEPTF